MPHRWSLYLSVNARTKHLLNHNYFPDFISHSHFALAQPCSYYVRLSCGILPKQIKGLSLWICVLLRIIILVMECILCVPLNQASFNLAITPRFLEQWNNVDSRISNALFFWSFGLFNDFPLLSCHDLISRSFFLLNAWIQIQFGWRYQGS